MSMFMSKEIIGMPIDPKIYNQKKTYEEYLKSPLFLGENPGLGDTIHKTYPEIWDLYRKLESQNWSENEYDYSLCKPQLAEADPWIVEKLIRTIAMQWEADTVASRSIMAIMSNFITNFELFQYFNSVTKNEGTHTGTYSEIVQAAFIDPEEAFKKILSIQSAQERITPVSNVLSVLRDCSLKYGLGELEPDQDLYNKVFMFSPTVLALEGIQFQTSFSATEDICSDGFCIPIRQAVRKIAIDELDIHVKGHLSVIKIELATSRGQVAYKKHKDEIKYIYDSIFNVELNNINEMYHDRGILKRMTHAHAVDWIRYCATPVYDALSIETPFKPLYKNPIPRMDTWLYDTDIQRAAMEINNDNYRVGCMLYNDYGREIVI